MKNKKKEEIKAIKNNKQKEREDIKVAIAKENAAVKNIPTIRKSKSILGWPLKIFVFTLSLSLFFSVVSELIISRSGIIISVVVIFVLMFISVAADVLGVAATACSETPFLAMASRKISGAKEALFLIKHSEKVASMCCDVIGDVCGILSGSASMAIVVKAVQSGGNGAVLLSVVISSVVAALTVFAKSLGKTYAINCSASIIYKAAKILTIFSKKNKKAK